MNLHRIRKLEKAISDAGPALAEIARVRRIIELMAIGWRRYLAANPSRRDVEERVRQLSKAKTQLGAGLLADRIKLAEDLCETVINPLTPAIRALRNQPAQSEPQEAVSGR